MTKIINNRHDRQGGSALSFILLLVAAGVLVFLAYALNANFFVLGKKKAPELTESQKIARGMIYKIETTAKGFVPELVAGHPYDTIKFVNTDTKPHWIGAVSKGCLDLDSHGQLLQDEEYKYIFRSPQVCEFFDRLYPQFVHGAVTVQ